MKNPLTQQEVETTRNRKCLGKTVRNIGSLLLLLERVVSQITINPVSVTTTTGPQTVGPTHFSACAFTYSTGASVASFVAYYLNPGAVVALDIYGNHLANYTITSTVYARNIMMFDPLKMIHQETAGFNIVEQQFQVSSGVWTIVLIRNFTNTYYHFGSDLAPNTTYAYLGERASTPGGFSRYDYAAATILNVATNYNPPFQTATIWVINATTVVANKNGSDYLLLDRTTLNAVHIFTPPSPDQASEVTVPNNLNMSQLIGNQVKTSVTPSQVFLSNYDISDTTVLGEPRKVGASGQVGTFYQNTNYIINFGPYQYVGMLPYATSVQFYLFKKPLLDNVTLFSVNTPANDGGMTSSVFITDAKAYFGYAMFNAPYNFQSYYLLFDHCAYRNAAGVCQACIPNYIFFVDGSCVPISPIQAGYGLNTQNNSQNILACSDTNCINCAANYQICTVCNAAANYILMPVTSTCSLCGAGYFKNGTSPFTCYTCNSNCLTCESSGTNCTSCATGLNLFQANRTCGTCSLGYFFTSGACSPCSSPCLACTGTSNNCTACDQQGGYVLNSNTGQCIPVQSSTRLELLATDFDPVTVACKVRFTHDFFFTQHPALFNLTVTDGLSSKSTTCNSSACPIIQTSSNSFTVNLNSIPQEFADGIITLQPFASNPTSIVPVNLSLLSFINYPIRCKWVGIPNGDGIYSLASKTIKATTQSIGVTTTALTYAAVMVNPVISITLNQFASDLLYMSVMDGPFLIYPDIFLNQNNNIFNSYQLPNMFQREVDMEPYCQPPSSVFEYQTIDCNFLANFGNNLTTLTCILGINIIIFVAHWTASKLSAAKTKSKSGPLIQTWVLRTLEWFNKHYGLRFFMISMESNIKSILMFSLLNLRMGESVGFMTMGKIFSLLSLIYYSAVTSSQLVVIRLQLRANKLKSKLSKSSLNKILDFDLPESEMIGGEFMDIINSIRDQSEDRQLIFCLWALWSPIIRKVTMFLQALFLIGFAGKEIPQLGLYIACEGAYLFALIKSNVKVSKVARFVELMNTTIPIFFATGKITTLYSFSPQIIQNNIGGTLGILLAILLSVNLGYAIIMFLILLYQLLKKTFGKPTPNTSRYEMSSKLEAKASSKLKLQLRETPILYEVNNPKLSISSPKSHYKSGLQLLSKRSIKGKQPLMSHKLNLNTMEKQTSLSSKQEAPVQKPHSFKLKHIHQRISKMK